MAGESPRTRQVGEYADGGPNLVAPGAQLGSARWPETWPGIDRRDRQAEESTWGGPPIPQPGETMPPVAEERRLTMCKSMPWLRRLFSQDAELSPILEKIEEVMTGKPFVATKVWQSQQRNGGPSLQQVQEATPIGGCTSRALARWREEFKSGAAVAELFHKEGHAVIPVPWSLTQQEIGTPRPPSTVDTVRTREEMEQAIVDHCVAAMTTCEAHVVRNSDDRSGELLVNLKAQYKPEDILHVDPRMCLGLGLANEPAKEAFEATKRRGGFRGSRESTQCNDCAVLGDAPKGYKQVFQSRESRKRQRHLVPEALWMRACEEVRKLYPEREISVGKKHRIQYYQGIRCVVIEPTCLQFGATHSGQIFERRLGFVVSYLRQNAGLRICTQVDDLEIKSRYGPAATYLDMLIFVGTMWYFRWQLHLKDKKAEQLWPRNTWLFDGHVTRAFDLQAFSPEERDQRHRKFLENFIQKQECGQSMTLRDLSKIVGQQNSHRLSHYPTAYLLCATSGFLSEETTRLTREFGPVTMIWDQPIRPLPRELLVDLRQLVRPRVLGDHLRKKGPLAAQAIADASGYRVGYQLILLPDTVLRGSLPLLPHERELHHTVQESVGTSHAAVAAMVTFDLRGTVSRPLRLGSGNDNSAAVKNINSPGNKTQMVLHQLTAVLEARRRNVIIIGQKESKFYMDHQSNIDWDGRRSFRHHELGLRPSLVQRAAQIVGAPLTEDSVDMMACRSTRQTKSYVARYPDGDLSRLKQCDVQTYDLGAHPQLVGKTLYLYPPETMLTMIARQIAEQQAEDQSIILVYPSWQKGHSWMPILEDRIVASVLIPFDDRNWIHPGGTDRTDVSGQPKWPTIISHLSKAASRLTAEASSKLKLCAQLTVTELGGKPYYRSTTLPSSSTTRRMPMSPLGKHC